MAAALASAGLALVPLVAPTTPPDAPREICRAARGSSTSSRTPAPPASATSFPRLGELVSAVRAEAEAPVAVGFGIGTPEQAAAVGRIADGVIIGTRLVRAVAEASDGDDAARAVTEFLRATRDALAA